MHNVDIRNVSIGQMLYFVKTVEYGSVTQAAKDLNLSQPTLSKKLKSLEQQLDLQLFVRTNNSIALTPAAQYLYNSWKNRIDSLEKDVQYAHVLQRGQERSVVVGCMDSVRPESFLLPIIRSFSEIFEDAHIRVESESAHDLRKMLLCGDVDVIFSILYDFEGKEWSDVAWEKMGETPHCACMHKRNPLSDREEITMNDLKRSDFVCIAPQYLPEYSEMILNLAKPFGYTPNISKYVMSANSLTLNLDSDNEVFLCDKYYADQNKEAHALIPIAGTQSAIVMAWRKDNRTAYLKEFLNEARIWFEENQ